MFIYVIVNSETLKIYVGQHKGNDLGKYLSRKFWDANHHTSGTRSHLYASMRKHPREVWSIHPLISGLQTREECDYWERLLIKALNAQNPEVGYNICDGGEGHTGPLSEETRRKISESNKQFWAQCSEETRYKATEHFRQQGRLNVESGHIWRIASPKSRAEGGHIQGPIQGRRNVESGQLDRICELPQTKAARRENGRRNVESGHLARMRALPQTKAALKVSGRKAGQRAVESGQVQALGRSQGRKNAESGALNRASHIHWHIRRGISNPACVLCQQAKAA